MYMASILLKVPVPAKVWNDSLEASRMSGRESAFSTESMAFLLFVSPPNTGVWATQGATGWEAAGQPGSVRAALRVSPGAPPFLPGSRALWGSAQGRR